MTPNSLCVGLVVVLARIVLLVQGQTITCRYADSILANGTCFRYNSTRVTWAAGKAFCASMNGALAMINSSAQMVTALKNVALYSDAWVGANDIDVEGTFIWDHDKSPVGSSLVGLWAPSEPSNTSASYDCGEVYRGSTAFEVYASYCTSPYGTLCMEMPIPTTTSTTTTTTTSTTTTPTTSPTTTTSTSTTTTSTTPTTTTSTTPTTTTSTTPTTTTSTTPTTTTSTTPTTTTSTTTTTTKTTPITTTTLQTMTTATTTTTTTSTPASTTLTASTTTAADASTVQPDIPTQPTVNETLLTDATSASPEPTTPESTTTSSEETSPPATIERKAFMDGGVEPVKLNVVLYALPALIALFFKQDGRLHLP